jgi:hypothetical protein
MLEAERDGGRTTAQANELDRSRRRAIIQHGAFTASTSGADRWASTLTGRAAPAVDIGDDDMRRVGG